MKLMLSDINGYIVWGGGRWGGKWYAGVGWYLYGYSWVGGLRLSKKWVL